MSSCAGQALRIAPAFAGEIVSKTHCTETRVCDARVNRVPSELVTAVAVDDDQSGPPRGSLSLRRVNDSRHTHSKLRVVRDLGGGDARFDIDAAVLSHRK